MKFKRFSSILPKSKSKYLPVLALLIVILLLLFVNMLTFKTYEGFNVPTYTSTQLTSTIPFNAIALDNTKNIITTSGPSNSTKLTRMVLSGNTITMTPIINNNITGTEVLTCDSVGNIYLFSNFKIFRIKVGATSPQLYAGSNTSSSPYGYVNGPPLSAKFSNISAMVCDPNGSTLFLCDTGNHCIRMIGGGNVSTLAGSSPTASGGTSGNIDNVGSNARFNNPSGITMDNKGNLFVSDTGNKSVRLISRKGQVKTIARGFNIPQGITVDPSGNVYVLDSGNKDLTMLAVPSYAKTTIISGADKVGSAPANFVRSPTGTFLVKNGPNMLFSIAPGSNVTQPAQAPAQAPAKPQPSQAPAQAQQPAQPAAFRGSVFSSGFVNSMGITIDSAGNIYATNGSKPGSTLSKISTTGTNAGAITRFGNASFFNLMDIKLDSMNNVYISDAGLQRVYKISTNGNTGIYSGVNVGYANGPALSATFNNPDSMIFDTANNLYVCDTNNHCIRRIAANGGDVTTYAGALPSSNSGSPGSVDGVSTAARFNQPKGITIDRSGNLYVTDSGNKSVRQILTNGQVKTIATGFNSPNGITIDTTGNLYVVDSGNRSVTMLSSPTYNKTTVTSSVGTSGWTLPVKITRSSAGILYVTDAGQNNIWKV